MRENARGQVMGNLCEPPFNESPMSWAYRLWRPHYPGLKYDHELEWFIHLTRRQDWLRGAREALQLSMETVAQKLNVSTAAYAHFEQSERDMTIKLATLVKVAAAMDCELIYALRPKSRQTFSELVWNQLVKRANGHPRLNGKSVEHAVRALLYLASYFMSDANSRRELGWAQKRQRRRSKPWS